MNNECMHTDTDTHACTHARMHTCMQKERDTVRLFIVNVKLFLTHTHVHTHTHTHTHTSNYRRPPPPPAYTQKNRHTHLCSNVKLYIGFRCIIPHHIPLLSSVFLGLKAVSLFWYFHTHVLLLLFFLLSFQLTVNKLRKQG